jgi:hypothetical protein
MESIEVKQTVHVSLCQLRYDYNVVGRR